MTPKASGDGVHQILAAQEPRLGGFKFSIGYGAFPGADDRTPANCKSDSDNDDSNYDQGDECQFLPITPSH
jgi:hypothetical protein